jgi:hypothetical protein
MAAAARARMLSHHSWAASMNKMASLIEKLSKTRIREKLQQ